MITRLKLSTIEQGLPKYRSMLAGNDAYIPTSFESIASNTLTSNTASVTFSSISGTYQHLQLRINARTDRSAVDDFLLVRFNSDTGSNYTYHILRGNGSAVTAVGGTSQASIDAPWVSAASASADMFGSVIIDIHDYASSTKYKTTRTVSGYDQNGSGSIRLSSGLWLNTNAITSISIAPGLGTNLVNKSTFALYGIKG